MHAISNVLCRQRWLYPFINNKEEGIGGFYLIIRKMPVRTVVSKENFPFFAVLFNKYKGHWGREKVVIHAGGQAKEPPAVLKMFREKRGTGKIKIMIIKILNRGNLNNEWGLKCDPCWLSLRWRLLPLPPSTPSPLFSLCHHYYHYCRCICKYIFLASKSLIIPHSLWCISW